MADPLPSEGSSSSRETPFGGRASFERLPRPVRWQGTANDDKKKHQESKSTSLQCPNSFCPTYAAVQWECSGILDDGTGQAKLYADREAALTLLCLTPETIKSIEEGAWSTERGLRFSRFAPPPSHLKKEIQAAKLHWANERLYSKRPILENDVLKIVNPKSRAEYLLHQRCRRSSKEAMRRMDYFVRCKPLKRTTTVPPLPTSNVKIFVPGGKQENACTNEVPSFSLPPLKLELVDSTSCQQDLLHETWQQMICFPACNEGTPTKSGAKSN